MKNTKSINIIVIPIVMMIHSFIFAQIEDKIQFGGFVELDHISYFDNDVDDTKISGRNQGIIQLEAKSKIDKTFNFFGSVEIRNDLSDPDRNRVFIDEAYMDMFFSKVDVRIGKQIIAWGEADGINPTNNINPIDYSDLIDTEDERIGVFSLQAKYYVKDFTFEGVIIPVVNSSILPNPSSRWFLDFPTQIMTPTGALVDANFSLEDTKLPAKKISNAQYALKAKTSLKGWDLSVSYFNGYDDLPSFQQSIQPNDDGSLNVVVTPEVNKLEVYGFDFSTIVGKYGLRGELAYFKTDDPNGTNPAIDDPFYQYVIGLDRNFSNVIQDNNMFVIVQWIHQIIETGVDVPNTNLNNIFQQAVSTKIDCEISPYAKISLQGIYDFKAENHYVKSELLYNLTSDLKLGMILDIFGGEKNTFFGNYNDNNRAQLKLKYSF
ncbi:DUF1302 family protein [Aquimarina sp. 2201CG5-10]|uniref:DUF1302 family protein n=1 Tax=Aquimarina callyspongiae TaxID=3098150 RepID=UPI002AB4BB66|nr:DUF1302 family protein [Aquimarina sp. 2201CG5-10]MDY8138349.1 DUF1302 family protein [Aquimarina sp. 2201CG5-10]